MAGIAFTAPGGGDPVQHMLRVGRAAQPTTGDALYAGENQRTRILSRTERGVDYQDAPFAPYSTKGPYYFYPAKGQSLKARGKAAGRRSKATGGAGVRTPYGIRYASYGAAKAALGRGTVDLFGIEHHPHMLNAMAILAGSASLPFGQSAGGGENLAPVDAIQIGFWGDEAKRARGHNEGTAKLPRRRFLDASESDKAAMERDMGERIDRRMNGI